jgi:predicted HicB family RNase H-like nuclease
MKQPRKYAYPARYTSGLHEAIKAGAEAGSRSINAHISKLLSDSLTRYPVLDCLPVVLQQADTSFGIRIPYELHDGLAAAAQAAGADRSFNQEIVGRLMLMTNPSRQTLIDAWSQLNQVISQLIKNQAPNALCTQELQTKRESFEWHLKHTLAVEAV